MASPPPERWHRQHISGAGAPLLMQIKPSSNPAEARALTQVKAERRGGLEARARACRQRRIDEDMRGSEE
jgi:hypothetical protein